MKKNKLPNIVILMILTLITTVFWVGTSVYRSVTKPTPISIPDEVLNQINPKLDITTIDQTKSRVNP